MDDKHKAEIYSSDWIITMTKIDHEIKIPKKNEINKHKKSTSLKKKS